ncbi:MAG: SufE family protein [Planctomycetaceae bacterium]|nr:SufE family protein [Planctomycetaceae bacterium]
MNTVGLCTRAAFDQTQGACTLAATELMTLDELYEEFDFLPDWEDRCDFLIDLGMELPKLSSDEKIEPNRVHGCQSMVWLVTELDDSGDEPVLRVRANSDAMIVNGLIAVLLAIYDGKTPREVLDADAAEIFKRLELDRHLSSQRKNGLSGMVTRLRQLAAAAIVDLDQQAN